MRNTLLVVVVLTAVAVAGLWARPSAPVSGQSSLTAVGVAFAVSGARMRIERHGRWVGALAGVAGLLLLASAAAVALGAGPMERFWIWGVAAYLLLPGAALAYPSGPRLTAPDQVAAVLLLGIGVATLVFPGPLHSSGGAGLTVFGVLVVTLWWRFERSTERDRQSLLWLALGAGVAVMIGGHLAFLAQNPVGDSLTILAVLAVPVAMAVGVVSPAVVDIRALTAQVVVVAVTVLVLIATFVGVAATLQVATGHLPTVGTLGVLAAVLGAGFHPVRVMLRGVVDRMLFGDRPDPLAAASQVGTRISGDPVAALRALREALVLPYAAVVRDGRLVAVSGTAVTHRQSVPLVAGDIVAGDLVVGLRAGELRLGWTDTAVLRIIAPALAQALHANALATELEEARNAMVSVVEEERRRLRRDLHDGLGPTLTGVAYAADAARNTMADDPAAADALLRDLREQTAVAIAEIRRLVEGLRPPALDELGLVKSLRHRGAQMMAADGRYVTVEVEAPDALPELSAAVEVAAYRIVNEALVNVTKHAGCTSAVVVLKVEHDVLEIEVRDHGRGDARWQPGAGMSSMRERAEQVGGSFSFASDRVSGRVHASLPLG